MCYNLKIQIYETKNYPSNIKHNVSIKSQITKDMIKFIQ